jgi:hypothetical protein
MDIAYHPEDWQTFYTTVATAAAALTGLLFVAMSINLRLILREPSLRGRARETLGGMIILLGLSLLALIPGQNQSMFGAEMVAGSVVVAAIAFTLQSQTVRHLPKAQRTRWVMRVGLLDLGTLCGMIGGISLLVKRFGGMFWLVPTVFLFLFWNLFNAWTLMVQAAQEA